MEHKNFLLGEKRSRFWEERMSDKGSVVKSSAQWLVNRVGNTVFKFPVVRKAKSEIEIELIIVSSRSRRTGSQLRIYCRRNKTTRMPRISETKNSVIFTKLKTKNLINWETSQLPGGVFSELLLEETKSWIFVLTILNFWTLYFAKVRLRYRAQFWDNRNRKSEICVFCSSKRTDRKGSRKKGE